MTEKPTYEDLLSQVQQLKLELEQKLAENSRLKKSYLSMISHEIRTPMHAVMGFVQLLSRTDISKEEREEYAQLTEQSGQQLMMAIDTLIDASLLDSGELTLRKTLIHPAELLNELYHRFGIEKRKMERNSVALLRNIGIPGGFAMLADGSRLEQVLSHLLSNALTHTHKGIIEFGCQLEENSQLRFYVTDSGGKHDNRELEILTNRLHGLENPGVYSNTGFLLSVARELVKLMEGRIWIEENSYRGATICFSIPAEVSDIPVTANTNCIAEILPERSAGLNPTSN